MANAIYPKAKQSFYGSGPSIDLDTDTIKIAAGSVVGAPSAATSLTVTLGGVSGWLDSPLVGDPTATTSLSVSVGIASGSVVGLPYASIAGLGGSIMATVGIASSSFAGRPSATRPFSGTSGMVQGPPNSRANPFAIGNLSRGSPFIFRPPNLNGTNPP